MTGPRGIRPGLPERGAQGERPQAPPTPLVRGGAGIAGVARIARVGRRTRIAGVAGIARVGRRTRIARVARIARVTGVTSSKLYGTGLGLGGGGRQNSCTGKRDRRAQNNGRVFDGLPGNFRHSWVSQFVIN